MSIRSVLYTARANFKITSKTNSNALALLIFLVFCIIVFLFSEIVETDVALLPYAMLEIQPEITRLSPDTRLVTMLRKFLQRHLVYSSYRQI